MYPRLLNRFSSTIPESRTRYFDAASTLVWYWSSNLLLSSSEDSSRDATRSPKDAGSPERRHRGGVRWRWLPGAGLRASSSFRNCSVSARYWPASERNSTTALRNSRTSSWSWRTASVMASVGWRRRRARRLCPTTNASGKKKQSHCAESSDPARQTILVFHNSPPQKLRS